MKTVIVCLLALTAVALARPEQYTDKYDTVDLDQLISNRRLLIPYVHCILEKGQCTAEGKELKSHIKEALETNCAKCTKAQKGGTEKMIGHLINHEAEFWEELKAKYDPTNEFTKKYETELKRVTA